jgi:hypothetical protein
MRVGDLKMKLISEYFTRFAASSEEHKFQVIVSALASVMIGISALVTFSIAIKGLSQGFPFVASMGLLICSLVLIMLVMAIPSITRLWFR